MTAPAQAPLAPVLSEDERVLVEFVLWHLRVRDLPGAVRAAAGRVAATRQHSRPAGADLLVDAPYRVTAVPRQEHVPMIDVAADARGVPGAVARLLLAARPQYVLVTDLLVPAEAIG